MKGFILFLTVIAVISVVINITMLDFNNFLGKENLIALIGIFAALSAIALLGVLFLSKRIQQRIKKK